MSTESTAPAIAGTASKAKVVFSPAQRRADLYGYLFLAPWLLGFLIFTLGPLVASLGLSFTKYNLLKPPRWVGLDNFQQALFEDDQFYPSIARTFYFALLSVPTGLIGSLILAILLNIKVKGTVIFRTLFYMPSLVPIVAAAILFGWLLHPDWGLVNIAIRKMGIAPPLWFADRRWAIPSLVLMSLWLSVGGTRMIIFLAGLQNVPEEMYDAASIDGAGVMDRVRHITLPLLSPTIFLNLVLGIIGALQVFTAAFVTTGGGPAFATWFINLHIYKHAFDYFNMGYACTLAWLFALIIVGLTLLQQRLSSRWVFYYGG